MSKLRSAYLVGLHGHVVQLLQVGQVPQHRHPVPVNIRASLSSVVHAVTSCCGTVRESLRGFKTDGRPVRVVVTRKLSITRRVRVGICNRILSDAVTRPHLHACNVAAASPQSYSLRVRSAGVFVQPQTGEVGQVSQMADLVQVGDLVLAHVELAQAPAAREVAQRADLVYTGTIAKKNSSNPFLLGYESSQKLRVIFCSNEALKRGFHNHIGNPPDATICWVIACRFL